MARPRSSAGGVDTELLDTSNELTTPDAYRKKHQKTSPWSQQAKSDPHKRGWDSNAKSFRSIRQLLMIYGSFGTRPILYCQ
ncbi:hypothetical protein NDU88_007686 [Pleurodeles waltl]|uniref:Uncharacterized protein n=1 Tax=Pleurodeles waltl TaxID=8319 RepID=A0AAV7RQU1_PLEWA|nr:hypothetical protein NDU88_007686 [Pleurodeles waltl]